MKLSYKLFTAVLVVLCLGCTCKEEKENLDIAKDIPVAQRDHIMEIAKKAEGGDGNAQAYLGVLYYTGTIGRNHTAAMNWFKKASENGSGEADFFLSEMYEEGVHVNQNADIAYKYLVSAANKSFTSARIKIAEKYANGEKVAPITKEEILSWLDVYIKDGNEKAKAAKEKVEKFDPKAKKTETKTEKTVIKDVDQTAQVPATQPETAKEK